MINLNRFDWIFWSLSWFKIYFKAIQPNLHLPVHSTLKQLTDFIARSLSSHVRHWLAEPPGNEPRMIVSKAESLTTRLWKSLSVLIIPLFTHSWETIWWCHNCSLCHSRCICLVNVYMQLFSTVWRASSSRLALISFEHWWYLKLCKYVLIYLRSTYGCYIIMTL